MNGLGDSQLRAVLIELRGAGLHCSQDFCNLPLLKISASGGASDWELGAEEQKEHSSSPLPQPQDTVESKLFFKKIYFMTRHFQPTIKNKN